jgi:hypothetical protein
LPALRDGSVRRELIKVVTLRDAIALRPNYPSLGVIERDHGIEAVEQYISVNIKYITDVLGLELNEAQFGDAVQSVLIIRWLTVADFKAFLEHCKKQKFYYRDYKEFLGGFQEYVNATLDTAEGDNIAEHNDIKAQEMQHGRREEKPGTLRDIYNKSK